MDNDGGRLPGRAKRASTGRVDSRRWVSHGRFPRWKSAPLRREGADPGRSPVPGGARHWQAALPDARGPEHGAADARGTGAQPARAVGPRSAVSRSDRGAALANWETWEQAKRRLEREWLRAERRVAREARHGWRALDRLVGRG